MGKWGCRQSPWEPRTSTGGWTLSFLRITMMMFCTNSNGKIRGTAPGNMWLHVLSLLLSTMSFLAMVCWKVLILSKPSSILLLHFSLTVIFRLCWPILFHVSCLIYLCILSINDIRSTRFWVQGLAIWEISTISWLISGFCCGYYFDFQI